MELNCLIDNFDVISFDVFDTLLLRPLMNPYDLFELVEKQSGAKGYARARTRAGLDSLQRVLCTNAGERSLEEIYSLIPEYAHLRDAECAMEDRLLVGNPEMIALYNEAKRKGKKVVIVSDMYLSGDFIRKKLRDVGIDNWDGFFLSSERKCRKDTGALFEVMLREMNVIPARVLHIGDTESADFNRALEKGIVSYLYPKVVRRAIDSSVAYRRFLGRKPSLSRRRLVAAVAVAHHIGKKMHGSGDELTDIGYQLLSVIGFAYAKFVCDDVRKRNIDKILLVARDGYIFEELIKVIAPDLRTNYIYAPRRDFLISAQNFVDNSYAPRWHAWIGKGKKTYQHRQIAIEMLKEWCGGSVDWKEDSEKEFLAGGRCAEDLQAKLDAFSIYVRQEYSQYIASFGFSSADRLAMLDITSVRGTAHRLLRDFIPGNVHAYYYFRNTGRQGDWDFPDSTPYIEGDTSFCVDSGFVEYFFSAPTPSVKCVRDGNPVFDSRTTFYDLFKFKCVELTREIVVDCARNFSKWNLEIPIGDFIDWKESHCAEIASKCSGGFSLVRESYGIANQMSFSPFRSLARRPLHLRVFGWVLLTAEVSVRGMKRYATLKLFGRLPVLKMRIPRR